MYNRSGENGMGIFDFHSSFFYLYWILVSIVLFPICFMLMGLVVFHSQLMLTNATTMDMLAGLD